MQARGLDHVVWAVRDLDATVARLEALGFTVTPLARHPWGTENHLVQLDGFFIEILTIGEAAQIQEPTREAFSFGAFNRDFLAHDEGGSMLVVQSSGPEADRAAFTRAGLPVFEPFSFERQQTRSDGTVRQVGFDLTFTRDADASGIGFFACYNRYPENFWSPDYLVHDNGARTIECAVIVCDEPSNHHVFLSGFTGVREMNASSLGLTITTPRGDVRLMPPGIYRALYGEDSRQPICGDSRLQAVIVGGADREAIAKRCKTAAIPFVNARDGLVIPASENFGLSLVFS